MADQDIEGILDDEGGDGAAGADEKVDTPVSKRIKGLIAGKTEAEKNLAAEREARLVAEFRADFAETKVKYPNAEKHKDAILEKVKKGYTVTDATLSVLNEKGELSPASSNGKQDAGERRAMDARAGAGGSADTSIDTSSGEPKDPSKMTQAERVEALKKLEQEGRFGISPSGGLRIG